MLEIKQKISAIIGVLVGYITHYYTNLETTMKVLIGFMIIDFILGIIGGYIEKKLSSNAIWRGGVRKGYIFLVIIVANNLATLTGFEMLSDFVIMYYVSMETLSIFEHAILLDVPLPQVLVDFAEHLKQVNDRGDHE